MFKHEYTTPSKNTGTWKKNYSTKIKFSSFGNHGRNIRGISGLRGRLMDLMGLTTGTLRGLYGSLRVYKLYIMERLCLTENIACLLYIVYSNIYIIYISMQMYNMHITMLCIELIRKHTVDAHRNRYYWCTSVSFCHPKM